MSTNITSREREFAAERPEGHRPVVESTRELRGLEVTAAELGIACVVVAKLRGPVSSHVLQQAAVRVQRCHPALRARFVFPRGGRRPAVDFCEPDARWLQVEELRPVENQAETSEPLWARAVEHECNHDFRCSRGYMFRIVWVPDPCDSGYLVISAPYALADEPSLMRVLSDLLHACANIVQDPALHRQNTHGLEPAAPGAALMTVLRPTLVARWLSWRARRTAARRVASGLPPAARGRAQTSCHFSASRDGLLELATAACERRGTTLRGLMGAAAVFAVLRLLREDAAATRGSELPTEVPVRLEFDLRPTLPRVASAGFSLSLFTGSCDVTATSAPSTHLWELAAELDGLARDQLRRRGPLLTHCIADACWSAYTPAAGWGTAPQAADGDRAALQINSLGDYPYSPRSGPVSLERVYCVRGGVFGEARFVVSACQLREHLQVAVTCAACRRNPGVRLTGYLTELLDRCHLEETASLRVDDYTAGRRCFGT